MGKKGIAVLWMVLLSGMSVHAGEFNWKCEWFGMGCSEGEENAVLMDLGRQSTNTGFLFFSGDTAVIERTLELTFSSRSISKGDKLQIQVESGQLSKGPRSPWTEGIAWPRPRWTLWRRVPFSGSSCVGWCLPPARTLIFRVR